MDSASNGETVPQPSLDSCFEILNIDDNLQFSDLSENKSEIVSEISEFAENFPTVEIVSEGEVFQDASQFFKNECQLEYLENIRTSNQNSWLTRDSLGKNFDPLFKTYGRLSGSNSAVEKKAACTLLTGSLPDVIETASESFDHKEDSSNNTADSKLSLVNGKILFPTRESIGNLMKFDSPVKKCCIKNTEMPSISPFSLDPVLYTEEDLKKLLKLQELAIEEVNLKKQKDFELEMEKLLNEKDNKIALLTEIARSLHLVLQNCAVLAQNLHMQNITFVKRIEELHFSILKGYDDFKAASENLQNVENELSNLQKSCDLAEELLKTYKSNENKLLDEVKTLQEKLLTLEEQCNSLQLKAGNLEEASIEPLKSPNNCTITVLQAMLRKTNLKESCMENKLKQAKEEGIKLNNIIEDLATEIGEI